MSTADDDETTARQVVSDLVDVTSLRPFPRTESSSTNRAALLSTQPPNWLSSIGVGRPPAKTNKSVDSDQFVQPLELNVLLLEALVNGLE